MTRRREGFGLWVIVVVVLVMGLAVAGGAAHWQNRELNRGIAEAYLGRIATGLAASAIEEAYHRLQRHRLPDWESGLASGQAGQTTVPPVVSREQLGSSEEFSVESLDDVTLSLVHSDVDDATGVRIGVVELRTAAKLRIGSFPAGITVTRRMCVRKRYYLSRTAGLRFLAGDVCREVSRQ